MARNRGVVGNIDRSRGGFALAFFFMFVITVAFLAAADALPEVPSVRDQVEEMLVQNTTPAEIMQPESPVRVVARSVGLDATVGSSASTDIAALDAVLLKGAVHYPTSALLGQNGTVLLFGHSSSLPIVHNKNFKAFNNIQNLKEGSVISVYSSGTEYRYAVTGVRLANAEEDVVELPSNGKFLTLVTCNNSFGTKTARYVVTAEFVEAYPVSN